MELRFRTLAKSALDRAKNFLSTGGDDDLHHAALELRFSFEAIVYDRVGAYRVELPPDTYRKWQPREVLKALVELSPLTVQTSTLSVGREDSNGSPPARMRILGTDIVISPSDIRAHYEALGSFLHAPTIQQMDESGGHDLVAIRRRCEACVTYLEDVLNARIWNSTLGSFSEMPCENCGKIIKRRIDSISKGSVQAKCFHCPASYSIENSDSGVNWFPEVERIPCPTSQCAHTQLLWRREITLGQRWSCPLCRLSYELSMGVMRSDSSG